MQEFALTMLSWWEDHRDDERRENIRIDLVKSVLIAGRFSTMEVLFPEYVADEEKPMEYRSGDVEEARRIFERLESGGVLRFDDL